MEFDGYDLVMAGVVIFVFMMLILLGLVIFDSSFVSPQASQDALNQCKMQGYDSYSSYDRVALSTKAIGVRCNYVNNEYKINGDDRQVAIAVN